MKTNKYRLRVVEAGECLQLMNGLFGAGIRKQKFPLTHTLLAHLCVALFIFLLFLSNFTLEITVLASCAHTLHAGEFDKGLKNLWGSIFIFLPTRENNSTIVSCFSDVCSETSILPPLVKIQRGVGVLRKVE